MPLALASRGAIAQVVLEESGTNHGRSPDQELRTGLTLGGGMGPPVRKSSNPATLYWSALAPELMPDELKGPVDQPRLGTDGALEQCLGSSGIIGISSASPAPNRHASSMPGWQGRLLG